MGTKIEWTDETWNPTRGCTIVSAGCDNCYAMRQAHRQNRPGGAYEGLTKKNRGGRVAWSGEVRVVEEKLLEPLSWKAPRRIFVDSMSDLWHDGVPDEFIEKVLAVAALTPQHTYQILTKRADRMLGWHQDEWRSAMVEGWAQKIYAAQTGEDPSKWLAVHLPLKNVWLGVSCEDQKTADERIPLLLQTPAAVRWISAEPLLGHVVLRGPDFSDYGHGGGWIGEHDGSAQRGPTLDWVVAGGESGHSARPMHPNWARSLRDQCVGAGVPFLFKQWGCYRASGGYGTHLMHVDGRLVEREEACVRIQGRKRDLVDRGHLGWCRIDKTTKKAAGRELDGRLWDEYPA